MKRNKIYGIHITHTQEEFLRLYPLRRHRIMLRILSLIGGRAFTIKITPGIYKKFQEKK